jgi:hypothetical protein
MLNIENLNVFYDGLQALYAVSLEIQAEEFVWGSFFVVIVAEFLRGWVGGYSLLIFATIMILAVRFVRGGFMEIIQVISPHLRDKYLMLIGKHKLSPDNVPTRINRK